MRWRRWPSTTRRAPNYFRKELDEYLLLAHEEHFDPLSIRGSYAGAMGALQFMPSSYRQYRGQRRSTRRSAICGTTGAISSPAPPTTCTSTAGNTARRCWPRRSSPASAGLAPAEHMALNDTLGGLRARGLT